MNAHVVQVHSNGAHSFSKEPVSSIKLLAGFGVEGDAHCGQTVKHRSRVAKDPTQPNLRQVHLIHSEFLEELAQKGFVVQPGHLGENITTRGLDVLSLSEGAVLQLGAQAQIRVTGLRNPCNQIEAFMPGLLAAVLDRTSDGALIRKAGIMGVVLESGLVEAGSAITITHSPAQHIPLRPV